jgi:hypothetical protein
VKRGVTLQALKHIDYTPKAVMAVASFAERTILYFKNNNLRHPKGDAEKKRRVPN